ncbi:MAG: helix-turn-helix domain-containing protein [Aeromonas veronii]
MTPPHREDGQAQYIEQPLPATSADSRLSRLVGWVRERLGEPHGLNSLAEKAMMSRRTLTRHFRQLIGASVGQWLQTERLAMTRRLLESSEHSVEQIAALSGLRSAESLRYHFRQTFGVSPTAWRKTFRGNRDEQ